MGLTASKSYCEIQDGYYPFNDTKKMSIIVCDLNKHADTIHSMLAKTLKISENSNKYINGFKYVFDGRNNLQPVYLRALLISNEEIHIIAREELHEVPYYNHPLLTKMNGRRCDRIFFVTDQSQYQTKMELIDWLRWICFFAWYYNPIGKGLQTIGRRFSKLFIRIGKLNPKKSIIWIKNIPYSIRKNGKNIASTEKRKLFHCPTMTHIISNPRGCRRRQYVSKQEINRVGLCWDKNKLADLVLSIFDDILNVLNLCIPLERNGTKYICAFCNSFGVKRTCKGCEHIWYCNVKCQKNHWYEHRNTCKCTQKYIEYWVGKKMHQKSILFEYAYN